MSDAAVPQEAVTRRRLTAVQRRAQLVAVGTEVFVARGYEATSLEDIAVAAGITRPLLYHYFQDKDELYEQIAGTARAELSAALLAAVAAESVGVEQLRAGLGAYFAFVRDHGPQWELLFGGGAAVTGDVAVSAAQRRFDAAEQLVVLVRNAAPHLDPTAAAAYAHVISGAAEQLAKWWRQHPEVTYDAIVGYHLDAVWTGLQQLIG